MHAGPLFILNNLVSQCADFMGLLERHLLFSVVHLVFMCIVACYLGNYVKIVSDIVQWNMK